MSAQLQGSTPKPRRPNKGARTPPPLTCSNIFELRRYQAELADMLAKCKHPPIRLLLRAAHSRVELRLQVTNTATSQKTRREWANHAMRGFQRYLAFIIRNPNITITLKLKALVGPWCSTSAEAIAAFTLDLDATGGNYQAFKSWLNQQQHSPPFSHTQK